MAKALSSGFHGYYDAKAGAIRRTELNKALPVGRKHFTIKEWDLSYRFYPHFHPYVGELVKRLIEGSVSGLQAADTDYQKDSDGALTILPGSTQVQLPNGTLVILPDGKEVTLLSGTRATLAHGTSLALPDGTTVALPGKILLTGDTQVTSSTGTSVVLTKGDKLTLANGVTVTLLTGSMVTLPDGKQEVLRDNTQVTVSGNAVVTFHGGTPRPELYEEFFSTSYGPSALVRQPHPVKELYSAAYRVYDMETFYHAPFTIAVHLSKNQRFEEAQRWFHYIFDPTDDSEGPTPERFWKVKPFQYTDVRMIEDILVNLSSGADPALQEETINSISAWKDAPFRPHVVARYRPSAYMLKTVMAYLDNLIAWGDFHFQRDTGEDVDFALALYIRAANILGPRPQEVPRKGSVRPQTYANLKKDLDAFGNALVELEAYIPFDLLPHPNQGTSNDQLSTLNSVGRALYFCVPRNDKLLSYWDTVADRLFKIRNSLNIQGIFRQLPLFEPPIDPALLAKAAAAGLEVGAVVSGINQPLPLVRFQFLVQKAAEICQEVKSLGSNLLSAMEKEDNEALAVLRAAHERIILGLVETVKYSQLQEAIKSREGLERSRVNAAQRYIYYERLLGQKAEEIKIPELSPLDIGGLEKTNFNAIEHLLWLRTIEVDIAQDLGASGGKIMSSHEAEEMKQLEYAKNLQNEAAIYEAVGSFISLIPELGTHATPVGVGAAVTFGGKALSTMLSMSAGIKRSNANEKSYQANKSSKIGSYARREQEWAYQSNLAAGEINQIYKQLRAAQIREAIAEREWKNHKQQIRQAEDIEHFLSGEKNSSGHKKISTQAFYTWMKREVKGLYAQCFQFAFDIAKKAERALQHELGNPELSYLQFGYLAGKEGLLAGEKLYLDIKRMEMAYHDLNQREYELTKHVSLLQVNPIALLQLRTTGRCTVVLPEELFDMDGPGQYFRRYYKQQPVAVSIPCVAGPYTSVNCTLTLLKSSIRKSPLLRDGSYAREGAEDDRFSDHFGSLQSIVTSTGQNDSGLFEVRDERYLPFENSGVISEWQLELPADVRQFDYDTISDVILHLRYTAREGGGLLRNAAIANLKTRIEEAQAGGSVRLFSVRHEFPTEWAKFKKIKIEGDIRTAELSLNLREEHFPFWSKGRLKAVTRVDLYAHDSKEVSIAENADGTGERTKLTKDNSFGGLWTGQLKKLPEVVQDPTAGVTFKTFKLFFNNNDSLDDLWLVLTWGKGG